MYRAATQHIRWETSNQ